MDLDAKVRMLDQANIECNWSTPRSRVIDTPDWAQIITPDATHSSANCVYRSRLDAAKAPAKVDEVVRDYRALKVPFRWLITPLSQPAGLDALLTSHGLSLLYEATAMMSPSADQARFVDPRIQVREISESAIDVYVGTFARCWELPEHQIAGFKQDVQFGIENGAGRFKPYVAYLDGQPVGTSALLLIPSGAYLAAGTVDPRNRGQGIYRAMVAHRARVAQSLGQANLLIHAKKHSAAPICKKMGFEAVFDYRVFSQEN